ncbi:hypothetical protein Gotur_033199 [Gossypium turneri]
MTGLSLLADDIVSEQLTSFLVVANLMIGVYFGALSN